MNICAISDTHTQHRKIKIPKCDIFIFAGDGEFRSLTDIHDFNDWLGEIDAQYKILISGNHDFETQRIGKEWCKKLFTNAIYLEDEEITLEGLKFYGSPWTPLFYDWAFMKNSEELRIRAKNIPENIDVLITHGPPLGILDATFYVNGEIKQKCGDYYLRDRIKETKPKVHIFGHLHEDYGKYTDYKTDYYNVSVLNEYYRLINEPTIIEI